MKDWELSFGFIPGILFGIRSYIEKGKANHVMYLGCIDVCLTVWKNE